MTPIRFMVTLREEQKEILTHAFEYHSLMVLLYDKFYLESFGDCRGIGRCGTCHVKIEDANQELLRRVGNEQTTLSKMENVVAASRLSCHIPITESLEGAHVVIVGDGDLGLY